MAALAAVAIVTVALSAAPTVLQRSAPTPAPDPAQWQAINWIAAQPAELNPPGTTVLFDARRTPLGAVAWGEADRPDPAAPGRVAVRGFIWTSADGAAWTSNPLPDNAAAPFTAYTAAVGDRGVLAFGRVVLDGAPDSAVRSRDGITWQPAAIPGGELSSWTLTATAGEYLVAGAIGGQTVVWSSPDGATWTAEGLPAPGRVTLGGLSVTSAGTYATGHLTTDHDWDAAIWKRVGAGAWERLAAGDPEFVGPERGADVTRIVPFDGGLLAIGSAGVLDPCVLGGRGLVTASSWFREFCIGAPPAAWVSVDGQSWEAVEGPRPAGWRGDRMPYLGSLEPGADGIVGLVNEVPDAGDAAFGVWTSADGRTWRRIGDFPRERLYPQATFAFPDRLAALAGTDDGHVVAWIGEAVTVR